MTVRAEPLDGGDELVVGAGGVVEIDLLVVGVGVLHRVAGLDTGHGYRRIVIVAAGGDAEQENEDQQDA